MNRKQAANTIAALEGYLASIRLSNESSAARDQEELKVIAQISSLRARLKEDADG